MSNSTPLVNPTDSPSNLAVSPQTIEKSPLERVEVLSKDDPNVKKFQNFVEGKENKQSKQAKSLFSELFSEGSMRLEKNTEPMVSDGSRDGLKANLEQTSNRPIEGSLKPTEGSLIASIPAVPEEILIDKSVLAEKPLSKEMMENKSKHSLAEETYQPGLLRPNSPDLKEPVLPSPTPSANKESMAPMDKELHNETTLLEGQMLRKSGSQQKTDTALPFQKLEDAINLTQKNSLKTETGVFVRESKENFGKQTQNLTSNTEQSLGKTGVHLDGNAVLNTLQQTSNVSAPLPTNTPSLGNLERLNEIKIALVDRILVSTAALDNKQTVRITFSQAVLPGTEVAINRQGNALNVTFVTTNPGSAALLTSTQGSLQQHLTEKLSFNEINVSVRSSDTSQGHPQDGRSRNRYDYMDPESEEMP